MKTSIYVICSLTLACTLYAGASLAQRSSYTTNHTVLNVNVNITDLTGPQSFRVECWADTTAAALNRDGRKLAYGHHDGTLRAGRFVGRVPVRLRLDPRLVASRKTHPSAVRFFLCKILVKKDVQWSTPLLRADASNRWRLVRNSPYVPRLRGEIR